jgi:antitoxin VapB
MPLYIKDETDAQLIARLARQRRPTGPDAVRAAEEAELEKTAASVSVRQRLLELWQARPLPPTTSEVADKAFFDELSGEP